MPRRREIFLAIPTAAMMHCGALAMGCPSPEDDHGHHGELPYVRYDRAFVVSGKTKRAVIWA